MRGEIFSGKWSIIFLMLPTNLGLLQWGIIEKSTKPRPEKSFMSLANLNPKIKKKLPQFFHIFQQ